MVLTWPAEFLLKNQLITLWGCPYIFLDAFSLNAFSIFSLYLVFVSLINISLCIFLLVFNLLWNSLHFLYLSDYFLSQVRNVFGFFFFFFSCFSSFSGFPIIQMLVHLMLSPDGSETVLISCFFFLYSVLWQWFPPFFLPAKLFAPLLQFFYYWLLLVYF